MTQMDFLEIIKSRGFVHQMTDEAGLAALLAAPGQRAYIGFDCTAKSLHVGSLLQIMLLRWWQKCGHTPIVLLGGGTTKIGDPSGKDESRPPLSDAQIQENMDSLKQVFSQFLTFSNNESATPDSAAIMVNNDDWLSGLNYPQFLREYGRHFSVNRMLSMDSVKLRLEREQPLSFLEFNYMILQAYDFVELNRRLNCRVQMGGSDQWGNIISGIDLASKASRFDYSAVLYEKLGHTGHKDMLSFDDPVEADLEIAAIITDKLKSEKRISESEMFNYFEVIKRIAAHLEASTKLRDSRPEYKQLWKETSEHHKSNRLFGITSPLLTTSSGAKMGKTAAGAVWLNADLCAPYDYWQYWRNTEDGDVVRFLKLFTELPLEQIAEYEGWVGSARINEAKIILATEATALLHGREVAEKAKATAAETFAGSGVSADLPEITAPSATPAVFELLVLAGFAKSNGEAKRDIKGNGVSLNDTKVTDENQRLSAADFAQGFAKLSKGKKQHVLVKLT